MTTASHVLYELIVLDKCILVGVFRNERGMAVSDEANTLFLLLSNFKSKNALLQLRILMSNKRRFLGMYMYMSDTHSVGLWQQLLARTGVGEGHIVLGF